LFPQRDRLADDFLGEASLTWVDRDESCVFAKAAANRRTPSRCWLTDNLAAQPPLVSDLTL
jgi:hypothetical protein